MAGKVSALMRHNVFASTIGNALEWYDFAIYGFIRCSGASVSYNFCLGIFGGTTPFVATYLVARTADDFAPAYYCMAVTLLQFVALIRLKEMAGKPLPQ